MGNLEEALKNIDMDKERLEGLKKMGIGAAKIMAGIVSLTCAVIVTASMMPEVQDEIAANEEKLSDSIKDAIAEAVKEAVADSDTVSEVVEETTEDIADAVLEDKEEI